MYFIDKETVYSVEQDTSWSNLSNQESTKSSLLQAVPYMSSVIANGMHTKMGNSQNMYVPSQQVGMSQN